MFKNRLLSFLESGITVPAQIFIGYLAVICLFFQTTIQSGKMDLYPYEYAIISKNSFLMVLALLLGLYLFVYSKKYLKDISPKRLFTSFSLLYLICGTLLIAFAPNELKDDVLFTFRSAQDINNGVFSSFKPAMFYASMTAEGYLYHNPHQLGLVTIERILMFISQDPRFFQFLNILLVIATNYIFWKIADILTNKSKVAANYSIFLSFLFYPPLLSVLFIYGILPANLLIASGYYFFLKYLKLRDKKYLICHLFCLVLAVLLKENSLIAVIAFSILYVLFFFKDKDKLMVLMPFVLCGFVALSSFSLKQYYQHLTGIKVDDGMSMISYLNMGINQDPNDTGRLSGWWNGYNIGILQYYRFDKNPTNYQLNMDMERHLSRIIQDPVNSYKFFSKKIASIWTDPMFESIWMGPYQKSRYMPYDENLASDIGNDGPFFRLLANFSNILVFILYVTSFLFLFTRKKIDFVLLFPFLYFLGGFIFHIFWEAKSQYAMTYVLLLLPVSVKYLSLKHDNYVYDKILQIREKISKFFVKSKKRSTRRQDNCVKDKILKISEKLFLFFAKTKKYFTSLKSNKKAIFGLFVVLQMALCLYYAYAKQSFYCDEIFQYGLANSEKYAFIDTDSVRENSDTGWITKEFYDNYVNVDKSKPFSFKAAYNNQAIDVHPPLSYMLLHIASYYTDHFSKWPGIILNLIFLLAFDFVFFYIANTIFRSGRKSLFALALFSMSSAGISNILYIRMYFILTFFVTCLLAINIHILKNKRVQFIDAVLLFLCVVCGGLTHYYFYLIATIMSVGTGLYLLCKKQIMNIWWYGSSMLLGFLLNIKFFPSTISQVLFKDRGEEVLGKLSDYGNFWLGKYINFVNQYMGGGLLYVLLCLGLLISLYKLGKNRQVSVRGLISSVIQKCKDHGILLYIIYVYLFSAVIVVGISFNLHRFVYVLYPFATIVIVSLVNFIVENLSFSQKTKKIIFSLFIPLLIILSLNLRIPDFQYREFEATKEKLAKLKYRDALVYYNGYAVEQHYTGYTIKLMPDETYYFNEYDISNLPEILEKRKTKDPLVVIITGTMKQHDILRDILATLHLGSYHLLQSYQYVQVYELE